MRKSGSIMVAFIPLSLTIFIIIYFIVNLSKGLYWKNKIEIISDHALISSMRIRSQGLEEIARRWDEFGQFLGFAQVDFVRIQSSQWVALHDNSTNLYRALSGFKGRITAVFKVLLNAHGIARDALTIDANEGFMLGIEPHEMRTVDENLIARILPHGWYKRNWDLGSRLGNPDKFAEILIRVSMPLLGQNKTWNLSAQSKAKLTWEGNQNEKRVQLDGLGGFPRGWEEAIKNNQFVPHRFPYFSARLVHEE